MTARLERPLKRELLIKGDPYRLTISPLGLHLARKGKRKGCELSWLDLVNGNAALATALNASLELHRQAASTGNGRGRRTKKFRYS